MNRVRKDETKRVWEFSEVAKIENVDFSEIEVEERRRHFTVLSFMWNSAMTYEKIGDCLFV